MGKRKERRHATHSGAGRRVKLDLFAAEPNGELGASSAKDEVGGEGDSKTHDELPNAPSSSGEGQANPLLLLGQYSDDELDEETNDGVNDAIAETVSSNLDDQVKDPGGEENKETATKTGDDVTEQKVEHENLKSLSASADISPDENVIGGNDAAAASGNLHSETNMAGQMSVPGTSDTQTIEDVSSGWKMVLHDESNSYYYWNIVTGETSWIAPDILLQGTKSDLNTAVETEERKDALLLAQKSTSIVDVGMDDAAGSHLDSGSAREDNGINDSIREEGVQKEIDVTDVLDRKEKGYDVSATDAKMRSIPSDANQRATIPGDFVSSMLTEDTLLGNANKECADSATQNMVDFEQHQNTSELSSNLVRHGEYLLGRLKSLKGSNGRDYELAKLMLAVEIRLHDMKSLGSYGSSLLPFWLHSESQLKELEAAIDDEVLKFCESANIGENSAARKSDEIICDDVTTDAKKSVSYTPEVSNAFALVSSSTDYQEYLSQNPDIHTSNVQADGYTSSYAEPKTGPQTEDDDTDMDVEMEVEDSVTAINNEETAPYGALLEHPNPPQPQPQPKLPAEHESPLEEGQIPSPPDEEWIPPPPPDDEPIPPPPPDEPPESTPLPTSDYQALQQFSYADHYNLAYHGSGLEYYGQTGTEVPSGGYYVDANGCQVAASLPQLYYAPVTSTYSTAPSGLVNPVEPMAYYAFQDGSLSTAPAISGVEPHVLQNAPDYASHISDENRIVGTQNEVGFTPVSAALVDSVGNESKDTSPEAHLVPASLQAPATNAMMYSAPVVSNPAVAAPIASKETIPKVQSKASRNKKRTVSGVSSLRSNKKVSGLVDKWKAAKEEMHEDEEEEPEDPYERLEKKRQREIEEWRAQQIASGEAKDNANFQPLGGDWRENVKRKRAKIMSEAAQASPKALDEESQQPDLNEVSRDLPSGWQAYWDESSKQVYYGNAVTAETTWIRPTN